jgi:hypothetical protein
MFYFLGFHSIAKKIDPIAYYFYHLNDTFYAYCKRFYESLTVKQEKREFDNTLVSEEIASGNTEPCHEIYEKFKSTKE